MHFQSERIKLSCSLQMSHSKIDRELDSRFINALSIIVLPSLHLTEFDRIVFRTRLLYRQDRFLSDLR